MGTTTGSEERLFQMAEALAGLIQQQPQWIEWNRAMEAADADPELEALMTQYRDLAAQSPTDPGRRAELSQLVRRIQRHPTYARRETAAGEMVGLLREVDLAISEKLGLEFASTAAPKKSGGCCG